jgi:excisionase family DNA binding protein
MPGPRVTGANGILTTNEVADLIGISLPTVRRYCDSNEFPGTFKLARSKERRIPATAVRDFYLRNSMAIPERLDLYVKAYLLHITTSRKVKDAKKAVS